MNNGFHEQERDAIYRVIRERRDVRRFKSDPIPDSVLERILTAAMQAPSVGYSQPWNFILVKDLEVRRKVHEAFQRANEEAKKLFPGERGEKYASLKLEGILDSAMNICVTCDRNRFGPVVLGRTCQPDMDLFSTVCAVQNLWLSARCEGVGVGWVSIIKSEELAALMKLPEGVVPIAYLCVGYTDAFAPEPELKTSGWLPQVPFESLIYHDQWGQQQNISK
jgi:5,6-dimethylbenzimidazole synthase